LIRKLRKILPKVFIATTILVAVLTVLALRSEYVAEKAHSYLLAYIEDRLQSKVEMGRPKIGWLKGTWYIRDISIRPHFGREERDFISARGIRISFYPWWNILKREIGIRSIEVEDPNVYLRVEKGEVANLPNFDFLKGRQGLFKFKIREIRVSGGNLSVSYPERPMDVAFNNVSMKVRPDIEKGHYGFILESSSADIRVREFVQKITSLKGEFSISPESLTVISGKFLLPEGNVSAEGFYLDFAKARWEAKASSKLDLAALRGAVGRQVPAAEKLALKGEATLSATIVGDSAGFDINGKAKAETIELNGFKITETSSIFSTQGRWDSLKESPFNIELRSRVPVEMASHYLERIPKVRGIADIHLKGSGRYPDVDIEGDLTSPRIDLEGVQMTKVSTRFKATPEEVNVRDASTELLGGSLRGDIDLNLKDSKEFNGKVRILNVNLDKLSGWWASGKPPLKVGGRVSGDMDLAGAIEPLTIDVSSRMQVEGLNVSRGESFATKATKGNVSAQLSYSGGVMRIRPSSIETPSSTVSFSGDISDRGLSLSMDINSSDLSEFYGQLSGSGTFKGRASGLINNPSIEGSMDLGKVSWGRYHADRISGDIRFGEGTLSSTGLRIKHINTGLSMRGEVSFKEEMPILDAGVELRGRLEDIASMAGIKAEMKGELSAIGRVKGGLKALDGEVEVKGSGINVMGEDIDSVLVSGRLEKGRFSFERGEVLRDGGMVTISGDISQEGYANLKIASSSLYIQNLPYLKRSGIPLSGNVDMRGDLSGSIKNPFFKGMATLNNVRYRDTELGKGDLAFSISEMLLKASGSAFGTEIKGEILLKDNKPFNLQLRTDELSLESYLKGLTDIEGVTGVLSGSLEIEGEISNPKGISAKGRLSKLHLIREPFFLKNTRDIEVEVRNERIILKPFQLTGKGTELSASGWVGMDGETNLLVNGSVDLYLLQLFTRVIEKGDGTAELQCAISGRPPKVEGKIVVRNGFIGFKGFEPVLSEVSGTVNLLGESLIIEDLKGRIGEGRFKGDGTIKMVGLSPKATDVSFDVSGAHLAYPKWLPSEVEGSLRLSGEYPSLLLSGNMNVVKARYSERVDWRTFLPSLRERLREPVALKEEKGVLMLDINFKAERNLIFENNVGKGELKGEVRLTGDTSRFGIVGNVEVISGKVIYKEHEFKITSGIIGFTDPKKIEAILDFTAEGEVKSAEKIKEYAIQIQVQGNIKDPKVTMTSSPPLAEVDIASLLSLGLTTRELQEKGGGAPAYGAVSILTREVEGRFKDYIGFDRFHIDPYYSRVTGTTEPKLTVGKDVSEDVSVIYSRGLSGTGEQEVQMEYKLYRNFSLMGGWSSFGERGEGDLGADVKFRFEFR
jgi:autotransporter translocation and assembly factor TamB